MSSFSQAKTHSKQIDPFQKIVWLVLFLHLFFLVCLGYLSTTSPKDRPSQKKITVINAHLSQKPEILETIPIQEPVVLERKKAEVAKAESKPMEKKKVTKETLSKQIKKSNRPAKEKVIKKPEPKSTQPSPVEKKESIPNKQKEMLNQAFEKIKKVNTEKVKTAVSKKPVKDTPALSGLQLDTLSFNLDASLNSKELAYRDQLAHTLKHSLKLPEYGEIKLKLTVERSGKIADLKILHSESRENKLYIEETLPRLKMPPFGENFAHDSTYSFTITLSHL